MVENTELQNIKNVNNRAASILLYATKASLIALGRWTHVQFEQKVAALVPMFI